MPPKKKKVCKIAAPPPPAGYHRVDWGYAEEQPLTATAIAEARTMIREQAMEVPAQYFAVTPDGIRQIPEPDHEAPRWVPRGFRLHTAPPMDLAPMCRLPNDPTPKGDFEMDA